MTQMQVPTVARGMSADVQEEIIRIAFNSYDRLPLFEVLMERTAQALGPALRLSLNVQPDVVLQGIDYVACEDALASAPDPGLVVLVNATPWDDALAVTIDPALMFAILEIMLGASKTKDAQAGPSAGRTRAFTNIEKRLGGTIVGVVLGEVATAFEPLCKVSFASTAIESGPRDVVLAPAKAGCVRVTFGITLGGREGLLCLIVPHQTMEPVLPLLAQSRPAGQVGDDPTWRGQLSQSLTDTAVTLTAVLHERDLPLSQVLDWKPGQVLNLGIDTEHEVTVACSGKDMFRAAIGRRRNGSVALRVSAELDLIGEQRENGTTD